MLLSTLPTRVIAVAIPLVRTTLHSTVRLIATPTVVVSATITPGANHAPTQGDGQNQYATQRQDSTRHFQEVLHLAIANSLLNVKMRNQLTIAGAFPVKTP
jgi:hypothetical protein